MIGGSPFTFGEADLHALVDRRLEPERQSNLLQRLRSHPAERARVETWREQNDLLRATFSEVESEPVPVSLNLAPPPRLRCVASNGHATPVAAPASPFANMRRKRATLMSLSVLMACAILVSAWWMFRTTAPFTDNLMTVSQYDRLASLASAALSRPPVQAHPSAGRDFTPPTIPDLGDSGFGFASAAVVSNDPPTVVFLFENNAEERLAVAVAKAGATAQTQTNDAVPFQRGRVVLWHHHGRDLALAGTIEGHRLSAIALDLQAAQEAE